MQLMLLNMDLFAAKLNQATAETKQDRASKKETNNKEAEFMWKENLF